jgi:hypothetical protein
MLYHINQYVEANVNENYKLVWIAPERVGSRSTARIFSFCGFMCRGKQLSFGNALNYTHNSEIPPKYKDYEIISSARNPYSRTVSVYKNIVYNYDRITFKEYVLGLTCGKPEENLTEGAFKYSTFINPILEKQPEYVIRLENIHEDMKKLPFIYNHLTEQQLEMMCEHGKEIEEWESYYDQEMKDLVYEHLKHQFDMWGYER